MGDFYNSLSKEKLVVLLDEANIKIDDLEETVQTLRDWKWALEAAGVDNWPGYEYAMESLEDEE